jgi:hypothetical protein
MSEQLRDPHNNLPQSARWDAFYASVDRVLRRRPLNMRETDPTGLPQVLGWVEHGLRFVPIYKIVANTSRYPDLDSCFQAWAPRRYVQAARRRAGARPEPVDLYQVGDQFFVKDGHQRVTNARARGQMFLPARITEYFMDQVDDLDRVQRRLLLEEQRSFLDATGLGLLRPEAQLSCTALGAYASLLQLIYSSYTAGDTASAALAPEEMTFWFDEVYLPIVQLLRRHRITVLLPQHSEADLFIWAMECGQWLGKMRRCQPSACDQRVRLRSPRTCGYAALRAIAGLRRALLRG